jgi:hypothetical protein
MHCGLCRTLRVLSYVTFGNQIKVDKLERAMAGLDISSTSASLQVNQLDHKPSLHTLNACSIGAEALESMYVARHSLSWFLKHDVTRLHCVMHKCPVVFCRLSASMSSYSNSSAASTSAGSNHGSIGSAKKSVLRRALTVFRRGSAGEAETNEAEEDDDVASYANKRVSSIF